MGEFVCALRVVDAGIANTRQDVMLSPADRQNEVRIVDGVICDVGIVQLERMPITRERLERLDHVLRDSRRGGNGAEAARAGLETLRGGRVDDFLAQGTPPSRVDYDVACDSSTADRAMGIKPRVAR